MALSDRHECAKKILGFSPGPLIISACSISCSDRIAYSPLGSVLPETISS